MHTHTHFQHPTGRDEEPTQGQQAVETSPDQGDRQQEVRMRKVAYILDLGKSCSQSN